MNSILDFVKSIVPYLPALIICFAIVSLFKTGLSLVAKVLSLLIGVGLAYWLFTVLVAIV